VPRKPGGLVRVVVVPGVSVVVGEGLSCTHSVAWSGGAGAAMTVVSGDPGCSVRSSSAAGPAHAVLRARPVGDPPGLDAGRAAG
jgi:hypothetical protein